MAGKRVYSTYLESVVASEPESYRDIRGLMERCQVFPKKYLNCLWFWLLYLKSYKRVAQALVATRNGLRGLLERTTVATEEEARSLEKFKEQKMGQVNQKMAMLFTSLKMATSQKIDIT